MSGLLVKSTVIMKENLEELTARGLAKRWPVLLGGAALTRTFVEDGLASSFPGTVRYAKDAFEGLSLMDKLMAIKSGDSEVELPALKKRVTKRMDDHEGLVDTRRSEVSSSNPIPKPPFWGTKVVKGIPLQDFAKMIDERALFVGQWGLRGGKDNFSAVLDEARPRLRDLLAEAQINSWFTPAVVYGYFPCYSEGNDLVLVDPEGKNEVARFTFPRQRRDRRLCIADFFRAKTQNELDVISLQVVTMGSRISEITNQLFLANDYRRYLELHGLSVQLTEALAEYWHARVRSELQIDSPADSDLMAVLDQGYQGSRYSFGYPACPDLSQQIQLCALLDTSRIEVSLSEEHQLHPEQSTSAIVVHHPEAKYFNAN
jgi:5-methyltetrahydrofolate--homocysteine methyltransferase